MASKKKSPQSDPRERGTFEIRYAKGNEWVTSSTRYVRRLAQLDAEDLEADGKRVQIVKVSDKSAYDLE